MNILVKKALYILFLASLCGFAIFIMYKIEQYNNFDEFRLLVDYGSVEALSNFLNQHPEFDITDEVNNNTFIYDLLTSEGYWNPLEVVIKQGDISKLKLLLAHGLSPNLTIETKYGTIGCSFTFDIFRQPEMLRMLLEAGADPNIPCIASSNEIRYPLYESVASLSGMKTFLVFSSSDVGPFAPAPQMQRELHLFLQTDAEKKLSSLKLLLEFGAPVNKGFRYLNHDMETPLMLACRNGRVDLILLLLSYGADPALKCKGKTASDYCQESTEFENYKQQEIVIKILQECIIKLNQFPRQ